jgi:O-6-methylguanine DNA methyltransferase
MTKNHDNVQPNRYARLETPICPVYALFQGDTLIRLTFTKPNETTLEPNVHALKLAKELDEFFHLKRKAFSIRYAFEHGTDFQKTVWRLALEIPYGQTRTYQQLAKKVGAPKAARAVGMALSRNPIPILVPCHRVVRRDHGMGGYAGGVAFKFFLLDLERRGTELRIEKKF